MITRVTGRPGENRPAREMLQYSLAHPYHAYYLAVVSSVYLVNQMDRYVYSSCQPPFLSSHRACVVHSDGRSALITLPKRAEFDQISGILFTVPFTLMVRYWS